MQSRETPLVSSLENIQAWETARVVYGTHALTTRGLFLAIERFQNRRDVTPSMWNEEVALRLREAIDLGDSGESQPPPLLAVDSMAPLHPKDTQALTSETLTTCVWPLLPQRPRLLRPNTDPTQRYIYVCLGDIPNIYEPFTSENYPEGFRYRLDKKMADFRGYADSIFTTNPDLIITGAFSAAFLIDALFAESQKKAIPGAISRRRFMQFASAAAVAGTGLWTVARGITGAGLMFAENEETQRRFEDIFQIVQPAFDAGTSWWADGRTALVIEKMLAVQQILPTLDSSLRAPPISVAVLGGGHAPFGTDCLHNPLLRTQAITTFFEKMDTLIQGAAEIYNQGSADRVNVPRAQRSFRNYSHQLTILKLHDVMDFLPSAADVPRYVEAMTTSLGNYILNR